MLPKIIIPDAFIARAFLELRASLPGAHQALGPGQGSLEVPSLDISPQVQNPRRQEAATVLAREKAGTEKGRLACFKRDGAVHLECQSGVTVGLSGPPLGADELGRQKRAQGSLLSPPVCGGCDEPLLP